MCDECSPEDDKLDALDLAIIAILRDAQPLPELTPEERAAMDALPSDFIDRILRGERPLGEP